MEPRPDDEDFSVGSGLRTKVNKPKVRQEDHEAGVLSETEQSNGSHKKRHKRKHKSRDNYEPSAALSHESIESRSKKHRHLVVDDHTTSNNLSTTSKPHEKPHRKKRKSDYADANDEQNEVPCRINQNEVHESASDGMTDPQRKKKKKHKRRHNDVVEDDLNGITGNLVEISEETLRDELNIPGSNQRDHSVRLEHDISDSDSEHENTAGFTSSTCLPSFLQTLSDDETLVPFSSESESEGENERQHHGRTVNVIANLHGHWTKEEDQILTRNWVSYITENSFDEPFCLLNSRWSDKGEKKEFLRMKRETNFYGCLTSDLKRSQRATYNRARKLFHPGRDIQLTEEDLKNLTETRSKSGRLAWSLMAKDLDVSGQKLIDFVRGIKRKEKASGHTNWTDEQEELLSKAIVDKLGSINHLDRIPWTDIANRIPGKNDIQCRRHWVKYLYWKKVYNHGRRPFSMADQLELINELRKYNVEDEFYIDWGEIRSNLTSQTISVTHLRQEWKKIKSLVPGFIMRDFLSIMDWLCEYHVPKLEKEICSLETET